MRHKWNYKRKGFLKIYVGVDVSTKQILALKIIDERSHDFKHLSYMVRESSRHGRITKVLGDGYDSREIFLYLDDTKRTSGIKMRRNSIPKTKDATQEKCQSHLRWQIIPNGLLA